LNHLYRGNFKSRLNGCQARIKHTPQQNFMCASTLQRLRAANKSVPYSLRGSVVARLFRENTDMTRNSGLQDTAQDIGSNNGGLPSRDNGAVNTHAGTDAAARVAHEFVDRVAKLAAESEQRIRNASVNAEHSLKETLDTARTKSLAAKESVGDLVQRHPWAAVGIAFGVGVLLSTLARRGGDQGD
jgi:ElaB/YqjD/DUF883 family membrane-anchored ribosome-binding protein